MKLRTPNNTKINSPTSGLMLALEPRFMFDAAGAATGAEVAVQQTAQQQVDQILPSAQVDASPESSPGDHSNDNVSDTVNIETTEIANTAPVNTLDSTTDLANALSNLQISSHARKEIVFVDTRVADYQSLLSGIDSGAEVVLLNAKSDGVAQIAQTLSSHQNIDAIHLISHGSSGQISLGSSLLNLDSINNQYADTLSGIGQHLSSDADILIYGCDFASGTAGLLAVNRLAELTGADIAASKDATGSTLLGGDWELEHKLGNIQSDKPFTDVAITSYDNLLAAPTITDSVTNTRTVSEDSNLSVTGITIADSDLTDTQTVTLTSTTGTLTLNSTTGLTGLSGDGTGTVTFSGSLTDINNAINGMTFRGLQDQNGAASFTVQTNDGTTTTNKTINIAIAPNNDIPAISGGTPLSITEGGSANFSAASDLTPIGFTQSNLGLTDVDNSQNQVIIKIKGLPSQGILKLNGKELAVGSTFAVSQIAQLSYVHGGGQVLSNSADTFQITVDDGAGGLLQNQTVSVNLTPVNQAPTASGTITVIEGESLVALAGAADIPGIGPRGNLVITDPDDTTANSHDVTIVSGPSHGILRYNGNIVSDGVVISNADLSKFTYSHDGTETSSDSFKIRVTDDGGSTGSNDTSADQTINLNILPNNDDPTLVNNTGVTFGPDSGAASPLDGPTVTLTPAMLSVADIDSPVNQLTYEITSIPTGGYLTSTDHPDQALPVGYTFTQQDLANNKISFVSTTGSDFDTNFQFTVKDGDRRLLPNQRDGGIYPNEDPNATLTTNTFDIHYRGTTTGGGPIGPPLTFAPPNIGGTLTITAAELFEDQTIEITNTHLNTIDPDNDDYELVYRLLSLPDNGQILLNGIPLSLLGSFTQRDVNEGRVSFRHDGNEIFTSSFEFDVSDGKTSISPTTPQAYFSINVTPQNDTPSASGGTTAVKLKEGDTQIISQSHIVLADADNSEPTDSSAGYADTNVLKFSITDLPDFGSLLLNGSLLIENDVITEDQLKNNELRYVHNGSENFVDQFIIQPFDNKGVAVDGVSGDSNPTNKKSTGGPLTVPITIFPFNDAPDFHDKYQLIDSEAGAITEGSEAVIGGATGYTNIDGSGTPNLSPTDALAAHLVFGDPDNSSEQRQYRVTTAPTNGSLLLSGTTLSVGSVFTQADLDSGNISYRHNGSETATDFFEYVVSDGDFISNDTTSVAQGSSPPAASRYNIEILPSNDKPTVAATVLNLDVTANGGVYVNVPTINVTDLDLNALTSGETDFLRVEVSMVDSGNTLVSGAKIKYSAADPTSTLKFVSGKDTNTLVIQGTKGEVSAILASLQVANTTDRDSSTDKLHIVVDDRLYNTSGILTSGANGGTLNQDGTAIDATNNRASTDIILLSSNVNDPPTISNASNYTVNEDALLTLNGFTLTDVDSFDKNVTVVVQLFSNPGRTTLATTTQGRLTYSGLSNVTASGTGSNTVTLTGSMANVQTALNSLKFDNAPDFNGTGVGVGNLYLRTTFTDYGHANVPAGNSVFVDNTIAITPVNDAPVLTVPGSTFVLASGTSVAIPGISFQDTKDTAQGAADSFYTVTILAPTVGDTLAATVSGSATSSYNSGTRTLTVTGSRTDVNATLANLAYAPVAPNADATYTLNVTVNDTNGGVGNGVEGVGIDGNNTASNTVRVFVSGINDPAPITANTVTVDERYDMLNLTAAVGAFTVADPDDNGATNLSATVTVSKGVISAVGASGGTVTGTGSATITITGASEAQINARLQALTITFPNETGIPDAEDWNGSLTATVTFNDNGNTGVRPASLTGDTGVASSDPGDYAYFNGSSAALLTTRTINITVNPVNDAPIRADANPVILPAVLEDVSGGVGNTPPGDTVANLFTGKFNDARDGITNGSTPNNFAGVAITANSAISSQGTWQYSVDGSNWTDLPAVSNSNAFLLKPADSLRFVPTANFHGTPGGLSVRLADDSAGALTTGNTANVSNDTSLSGGTTAYSNSSNAVALNTTVTNVNDRPTASNGTLTSTTEDNNNPPGATISSLGFAYGDATDNQLSISGGGNASTAFGGIAVVGNLANSATEGVWQYNTGSGWVDIGTPGDASALILPTTASLRFLPNVANFNGTPGNLVIRVADSTRTFSAASDISGNLGQTDIWSETITLGTQVSKQNDAPTLTHTASNPTATENGLTASGTSIDPINLLNAGNVSDLDLASTAGLNSTTFGAGTITITLSDGIAGDVLQINGALPAGVTSSGGTGSVPLVVNLDNDTSLAEVKSILEAIQYKNTSDNPTVYNRDTTRSYTVVLMDGNNTQAGGNSGGPTALAATTINGVITLVATNDPPVAIDMTNANSIVVTAGPTSIDPLTGTDIDGTVDSVTILSLPPSSQGTLYMADGVTAVALNQVLTPTEAAQLKFDPSGTYSGTTTFTFTVTDNEGASDATPATATIIIDNTPPVAANDIAFASATGVSVTLDIIANDSDAENNLDPATVKIVGTTNPGDSLVVTGEGTWSVNGTTGAITFTPETGFVNDPTPIEYTVKDRIGAESNLANVSVDYPPFKPFAVDDSNIGISGQPVTIDILGNDLHPQSPLVPGTVHIVGTTNPGDPLDVTGEGTWSINPTSGAITFTPLAGFTADPTPIRYTVKDNTNAISNEANVSVDYPQTPPLAVDDSAPGIGGQPVTLNVLGNDSDPENDLDPATLQIVGTAGPGVSLVVAGEGIWSVNTSTGEITFTPESGFIGDPTPIDYTVADRTGLSSNPATVSIDYPPYSPVAIDDRQIGSMGQPVIVDVLANDTDPENDIDPTSVQIVGTPRQGDPLVVPGEGVWEVDLSTGVITFTPEGGFTDNPTPISYTVKDSTNQISNAANVSIDYPPTAIDDNATGATRQPVTINVLGNDSDPDGNLDPTTVQIAGTVNPGESLVVPGQGIWTVDPSTGAITFTPETDFTGDPTPINYTVKDTTGLTSNPATVSIDYPQNPPVATNDNQLGISGQAVTINVLANDSDPENDRDPATVQINGTTSPGEPLVVAGQGVWSINSSTGAITFTPEFGFTGDPTPINYTVKDTTGLTSNPATVSIDYPQNPPVTANDNQIGVSGQTVTINVLGNDTDPENDIDPATIQITGTANPGDPLVVPGQGVWSISTTGAISFTPETGFFGDPSLISYSVTDRTGQTSNLAIVSIDYPPTAIDDSDTGTIGEPVTINVLGNDSDPDNDLDPTSLQIVGTANPGDSLVVPGEGVWSINPATGEITFTPITGFTGDPTPIRYTVKDHTGLISNPAVVSIDYTIVIPPDNIWGSGNGSIPPSKPIEFPEIETTTPENLHVIDAVNGGNDLNSITAIGKRSSNPIFQTLQRLNTMQFRVDRLGLFALNRYQDIDLPISREVDRIERLRQFDDIFQRISNHGNSSWHLGGLRHSITLLPEGPDTRIEEFLSVHTKLAGNLLYVEFEHTVNTQAVYDIDHVHVQLADGRPLPEWLSFDNHNGILSGIPPAGGEIIELHFSTKLQDGRILSSEVEIEPDTGRIIELRAHKTAIGHTKFSDQITQSAGRFDAEKTALRQALER